MDKDLKKIICYGEGLWDLLDAEQNINFGFRPGGATLNGAYHLNNIGVKTYIISSVGNDIMGKELLKIIKKGCGDFTFCLLSKKFTTGKALATLNLNSCWMNDVSYEIMEPVAWDSIEIEIEKELSTVIKNTDGFVFQSLTARNLSVRKNLHSLLEKSWYKIFDVNLRPPFYSEQIIKELIEKSDIVKMSDFEFDEIVSWFYYGYGNMIFFEEESVCFLKECFNFKELLITKGTYGASCYVFLQLYERYGITIKISDTIGSGDAFLSGEVTTGTKRNIPPHEKCRLKADYEDSNQSIHQAVTVGAFVASKDSSVPGFDK